MTNFTFEEKQPQKATLDFIRLFARLAANKRDTASPLVLN